MTFYFVILFFKHAVNFCEVMITHGNHFIWYNEENTLIFEAITGFPFILILFTSRPLCTVGV